MRTKKSVKIECVTRAALAESVACVNDTFSAKKATEIVDSILNGISDTLSAKGEEVKISGFGKFSIHEKKARNGRNPKTGDPITIAGRKVLKFKVSDCLKAEMNGRTAAADDE